MKYQALRPHFFSMGGLGGGGVRGCGVRLYAVGWVGGWVHGVLVWDVVGGGGRVGGGIGDCVLSGW